MSEREFDDDEHAASGRGVVLFVDDEAPLLRAIERLMRGHGFSLLLATNATHALQLLEAIAVDIVVSDFHLDPGMTGGGLLRVVAQRFPRVVRVLMSGSIDRDGMQRLVSDGVAQQFIDKPWPPGELQRRLLAIARSRARSR